MTSAIAPVAAEIIALRPPTTEMTTAIVKEAKRPTAGSTPAMIENEIASGISARATTRPARTSVRKTLGEASQSGLDGLDSLGGLEGVGAAASGEDMQPFLVPGADVRRTRWTQARFVRDSSAEGSPRRPGRDGAMPVGWRSETAGRASLPGSLGSPPGCGPIGATRVADTDDSTLT